MIEAAVLIGLAAWRVTALVAYERGLFDLCRWFRNLLGFVHDEQGRPVSWPDGNVQRLVACPWCLGLWAAAAMYGLWRLEPQAVMVVAAAAVLVAMEQWVNGSR